MVTDLIPQDPEDLDLQQVDSEDIPEAMQQTSVWQQVLRSSVSCFQPAAEVMGTCGTTAYKSCVADEKEELEWLLPGILQEIKCGGQKIRYPALQKLYRLTDRDHKQNRVPPVCNEDFQTIQVLSLCLDPEKTDPQVRRQALLILNNLCIPKENKSAILFGEAAEPLLTGILAVIHTRVPDAYLAVVTLLNLSYLQDDHAKSMMFNFIPERDSASGGAASCYGIQLPIDNPLSTIRTLELLLKDSLVYVRNHQVNSVEQQCCRWSLNVIRNLISVPQHCALVGSKTRIPAFAAECLKAADKSNLKTWTRDSLADAALMILVHVCKIDECLKYITQNKELADKIVDVCETLESKDGIHATRATALIERVEQTFSARSVGYSV